MAVQESINTVLGTGAKVATAVKGVKEMEAKREAEEKALEEGKRAKAEAEAKKAAKQQAMEAEKKQKEESAALAKKAKEEALEKEKKGKALEGIEMDFLKLSEEEVGLKSEKKQIQAGRKATKERLGRATEGSKDMIALDKAKKELAAKLTANREKMKLIEERRLVLSIKRNEIMGGAK